ncbi:MAG: hypothetical protein OYH77_01150 [Pseudomonadota bacterium]|nr:hypothetical protein [Pseudomonadota bacterium]
MRLVRLSLLALTAVLLTNAPKLHALEIVIMHDKDSYEGFVQNLNAWKQKVSGLLQANVEGHKKLGAFEVGYIKGHRLLSKSEISRDVDKHSDNLNKKWHELTLEASVAVPFMFPISGMIGALDVGIEANGKVSAAKRYRIIMPDVLSLAANKDITIPDRIDLTKHITKIYKIFSLPFDVDKLQQALPTGTEIHSVGERSLLLKIGPRLGITGLALKAKTQVFVDSLFSTQLKLLSTVDGKTFVKYRVESNKQNNFGVEAKLTTGITFLNTSFLDNVIGSEMITASLERSKHADLIYEFVYDLSRSEARKALGRAILGDLSMSQEIGTFRTNADDYLGVSIMAKRSDLLVDLVKSGKVAFTTGEKTLLPKLQQLVGQEFSGSFVEFSRNEIEGSEETSSVNALAEHEEIASYRYEYDKTNELLLGLVLNNVASIEVDSTALRKDILSAAQGLKQATVNRLSFNYTYSEKKNTAAIIASFFNIADNVIGANQPTLGKIVSAVRNSEQCAGSEEAVFSIAGTMSDKAIQNLIAYQPQEAWVGVAKIAGFTPAAYFRYETKRQQLFTTMDRKTRKLMKKFAEHAIPFWEQDFKKTDKKAIAERLRNLFKAFHGDPSLLELLIFLASADYRQDKDPDRFSQGMTVNVALNTDRCNLRWGQSGKFSSL